MKNIPFLAPTTIRDYLKAYGWTILPEGIDNRLYVFEHSQYPKRQLLIPMDTAVEDYSETVQRTLGKLSDLLSLELSRLSDAIVSSTDDVIRFRLHSDLVKHSVPLCFASNLLKSADTMLRAAACTVLEPKTSYPRLTRNEATQLVEKSRFDQTEKGSFVIKIACPVDALEVQTPSLFEEHKPTSFVRKATSHLYTALNSLIQAIEQDTLNTFVAEVKGSQTPRISKNLCDAVLEMSDGTLENSLDIQFDWSLLYKSETAQMQNRVRIQRDYFRRIEEVSRELQPDAQAQEGVYIGTVEKMEGVQTVDGRAGDVILALLLPENEEIVHARVSLNAEDYKKADQAHMSAGAYVQVSGRLHPGRKPRVLDAITSFSVVNLS